MVAGSGAAHQGWYGLGVAAKLMIYIIAALIHNVHSQQGAIPMTKDVKVMTLYMPEELHTALKIAAARQGTSLKVLMEVFARVGLRRLEDGDHRRGEIETYAKEFA